MSWLIVSDGTLIHCERCSVRDFTYPRMRDVLTRLFEYVASPLEPSIKEGQVVTLYLSGNREGRGRSGSAIYLWSVKGRK